MDSVARGERPEDAFIELKSNWPEAAKAARRIAAHANAARGNPILWIIGLHEDDGVQVRDDVDIAQWWSQVQSKFDEVSPDLTDLIVPTGEGEAVVALLFATDRAPYVVKNADGGGHLQREVPWREGTAVRSAHRSDLIRVLVPLQSSPTAQLVSASISSVTPDPKLLLRASLYLTCPMGANVVFPFSDSNVELTGNAGGSYRCSGVTMSGRAPKRLGFIGPGSSSSDSRLYTIHDGFEQLIVNGPGPVILRATFLPNAEDPFLTLVPEGLELSIRLNGIDLPGPVALRGSLELCSERDPNKTRKWDLMVNGMPAADH